MTEPGDRVDESDGAAARPDWWRSVEEHLAAREADVPDPWAWRDVGDDVALTADQAAFLTGLDDQPAPPRLRPGHEAGGGETGNSPGDGGEPPGVPSST